MKKMLIDGMTDNMGGLEKFIYTLFLLTKEKYHVDFITTNERIPFEKEFVQNGSIIHKITPRSKNLFKYQNDIKKVFKENKYDVFWFNKTTLSAIDCLKNAKKYGVKKIICHSHASQNMGGRFTLIMHKYNQKKLDKYVDYKLACSSGAAKWFYGENVTDVKMINNAIEIDKYLPDIKKIQYEKSKLQLEGKFVLGHIGRFSTEKNHKFLLDVFDELNKKIPAHLVLCGTGPLFEDIQQYAKEKGIENAISFLGVRSDVPDILQAIDVIVFPSIHEGLPFVLVEAQAAGIPCVVSDGVSDEVKLTNIVEFVNLNANINEWVSLIIKYKDYKKVSKEEELTKKGFSLENTIKEIEKILE